MFEGLLFFSWEDPTGAGNVPCVRRERGPAHQGDKEAEG